MLVKLQLINLWNENKYISLRMPKFFQQNSIKYQQVHTDASFYSIKYQQVHTDASSYYIKYQQVHTDASSY